ncbi:MAG TPA: carbohydrate-binding protein [Kiritimatiellia bacterium]|nr:carbohydrate-binding protein [Kiritimatiellia bacterium]
MNQSSYILCRKLAVFSAAALMAAATRAQSTNFPGELGSLVRSNGVTFRVWAPNASTVAVRGDFNGWGTTAMTSEGSTGYWSVDIPSARPGQEYQYFLNGSIWRRDPRARRVTHSTGNSIIYDPDAFDWGDTPIPMPDRKDAVLYQMHPGTFNAEDWIPSSFDKNIERLDHLRNLGINVIQLMPVNEFATDRSWGYNPSDLFAIESALGGPDALKRFVKAAHERGIAVFTDVVHNHYGPTDLALWQFDGWSQNGLGGIYFYNSTDGKAYTWWGSTRPDYSRTEVRDFIRDQIMMFVEEYRVGGFRWDSVFNIIYYNDGYNHNADGEYLLRDINWELSQNHPNVFRISEDNAFDYSMNFESMWDVQFHDHIEWQVTQGSDANRNMSALRDHLLANANGSRVIFSEAHDYVGDLNDAVRLPRAIDGADPAGIWARKRQLLAAAAVMTKPGIPMIFQGQEMNEDWTFSSSTSLRWALTNTHAGIVRAYRDLIRSRRNLRGGMQGLKGTGITVHHVDDTRKVIAYVRWDAGGGADDAVVAANFSANTFTNGSYLIEFPSEGVWYSHFNSDSTEYGADFGNIGFTQVTASGSPAMAAVDMGMYSLQIFSKTPPTGAGAVTFDPPAPEGCVDVTISYDPAGGPLAGATNVVLYQGRNNWLDIQETVMTNRGDNTWVVTASIPSQTHELNLIFHDGAAEESRVWDNNESMNWRVNVSGCASLPALVTVSPAVPAGCVPVTITYEARESVLSTAEAVFVHFGRNGWQDVQTLAMTNPAAGAWSVTADIPDSTYQLDFVFHDGAEGTNRVWDNNDSRDWTVFVSGCYNTQSPGIAITNPAADLHVAATQAVINIEGSSYGLAGDLIWTNSHAGSGGSIPSAANWLVSGIPLLTGVNLFHISGLRDTVNLNAGANDSATNVVYDAGWPDGANGGAAWGGGWNLTATPNSGHFMATNTVYLDSGSRAWGMWANSGGFCEAVRPFAARLNPGDVFTIRLENGGVDDPDSSIGVALENHFGQSLFEFLFVAGGTNYLINDELTTRNTGIPWSNSGLTLEFELTSGSTYRLTAGPDEFEGNLGISSEMLIRQVRIWNASAGGGPERDLFVLDMSIDGDPLEPIPSAAEVAVTRAPGDEPVAPPDVSGVAAGQTALVVSNSVAGQLYDIYVSTNLTGGWMPLGLNVPGGGGDITLFFTNTADMVFYTIGTRKIP